MLPKDVAALRAVARECDHEPLLLDATVAVDERQRKQVIAKLQRELHTLKSKRVALLGLAFKPNTDDLREAPSPQIVRALQKRGARAIGYDRAVLTGQEQRHNRAHRPTRHRLERGIGTALMGSRVCAGVDGQVS